VRIVVDTNILISAIFWGGLPGTVLDYVQNERCTLITSKELLDELLDVLEREKFAERLEKIGKTPQQFLANFAAIAELADVVPLLLFLVTMIYSG